MPKPAAPKLTRIELLQGTLDLIVLQSLRWGPQHGYGLVQWIRANSRGVLDVDAGSLYPALQRLERQRLVKGTWEISENRQRVRVYRLTPAGRARLTEERKRWDTLTNAIGALFNPVEPTPEEA
jgi:transcriptional regulator